MTDRDDKRPALPAAEEIDPTSPVTAEEIAASQRLRDGLESSGAGAQASPDVELLLALRAAWDPAELSAEESRAAVAATPSSREIELAARLRDALAGAPHPEADDVELAEALHAAFAPSPIEEVVHRAIVDTATAKMASKSIGEERKRRGTLLRVAFGVASGGLALAASIALVVSGSNSSSEAPLAKTRSTQSLFAEPFKPGETSARIDRIASARAADYRDNRFTTWGVR